MPTEHCIAITTVASPAAARDLARAVVAERLAACVQIVAIDSVFAWKGAVDEAAEALLVMKTREDRYAALEDFIAARHDYDVPEVVRVGIEGGLAAYLSWVDESVT